MKTKLFSLIICTILMMLLVFSVSAEEAAQDITDSTLFSSTSFENTDFLHNGNIKTYQTGKKGTLTLENEAGMAGIYLLFDLEYGNYTVTDNATGAQFTAGERGFLHEYLDLQAHFGTLPTSVTLDFSEKSPGSVKFSYFLPVRRRILSSVGTTFGKTVRILCCLPPTAMTTNCFLPV